MKTNVEYISYLLLQNKYLEQIGSFEEKDVFSQSARLLYPENWYIEYSIQKKIKILSYAIRNNKNIKEMSSEIIQNILNEKEYIRDQV